MLRAVPVSDSALALPERVTQRERQQMHKRCRASEKEKGLEAPRTQTLTDSTRGEGRGQTGVGGLLSLQA
jgi:hypothetical protein